MNIICLHVRLGEELMMIEWGRWWFGDEKEKAWWEEEEGKLNLLTLDVQEVKLNNELVFGW
jgi:hypothetical protein